MFANLNKLERTQTRRTRIFGLDLLRVFALLSAFAAHACWLFSAYSHPIFKAFSYLGFMAVECFFVLSGYLVAAPLMRLFFAEGLQWREFTGFLRRRLLRIMPAYWLVLLLNIGLALLLGFKADALWRYFLLLQNFAWPMTPFFPESWSMGVKEVPYFLISVWLLGFTFIYRRPIPKWYFPAFLTVLLAIGLCLKWHFHLTSGPLDAHLWNTGMRSVVLYRFDAVVLGMLMSWWQLRYAVSKPLAESMAFSGVLLLCLVTFLIGAFGYNVAAQPFFWNLLLLPAYSLGWALLLPFFARWHKGPSRVEPVVFGLAKLSYAIYLLHYSFLLWAVKSVLPVEDYSTPQLFLLLGAYIIATLCLSYLLYRFWEKPIAQMASKPRTLGKL